jgi:hypothetical protein
VTAFVTLLTREDDGNIRRERVSRLCVALTLARLVPLLAVPFSRLSGRRQGRNPVRFRGCPATVIR